MAQTGYTPISIYYSATTTNVPTAGNLVAGELAINTADGKLFYKDSSGVVQTLATKGGVGSSTTTQVLYNSSGSLAGSANMTFSGTALTLANDASISGLTVGKGGGSDSGSSVLGNGANFSNSTGTNTTAVGYQALYANTGSNNTGIGYQAGRFNTTGEITAVGLTAAFSNTTGSQNTAVGNNALYSNTTSSYNTAIGRDALNANTGASNSALGRRALYSNTSGAYNTGLGESALYSNTTANNNTAVGYQAGYSNVTGANNAFFGRLAGTASTADNGTAIGSLSMQSNTSGASNTAVGCISLNANTTGSYNVAVGQQALQSNTTASNNTAVGYQAGYSNTTGGGNGGQNTFIGDTAGYSTTSDQNTFVGRSSGYAVTTGRKNTILGMYNGNYGGLDIRTASNYIVLSDGDGNPRLYIDNNGSVYPNGLIYYQTNQNMRFPSTGGTGYVGYITSASNFQISYNSTSAGVVLTSGATSWGTFSDSRLKNVTGTYTNALADIAQIEPVKFTWKSDAENKPQVGVLAQSVQAVVPEAIELSTIEIDGTEEYLQIRYTELIPLMIASIQELKAEVDSLKQQLGK